MRIWMQHHFNAVHVCCIIHNFADWLAPRWERVVHPLLYRGVKND